MEKHPKRNAILVTTILFMLIAAALIIYDTPWDNDFVVYEYNDGTNLHTFTKDQAEAIFEENQKVYALMMVFNEEFESIYDIIMAKYQTWAEGTSNEDQLLEYWDSHIMTNIQARYRHLCGKILYEYKTGNFAVENYESEYEELYTTLSNMVLQKVREGYATGVLKQ